MSAFLSEVEAHGQQLSLRVAASFVGHDLQIRLGSDPSNGTVTAATVTLLVVRRAALPSLHIVALRPEVRPGGEETVVTLNNKWSQKEAVDATGCIVSPYSFATQKGAHSGSDYGLAVSIGESVVTLNREGMAQAYYNVYCFLEAGEREHTTKSRILTTTACNDTSSNTTVCANVGDTGITAPSVGTLQTPPAVASASATGSGLQFSGNDQYYGSDKMQSFRTATNAFVPGTTDFTVSYFENSQVKTAALTNVSGTFDYVSGSTKSRGCNVVRMQGGNTYVFLLFSMAQGTLAEFARLTEGSVDLTTATIAENCQRVSTSTNVYSVSSSGLAAIPLNAGGANVMAVSTSIDYLVAGGELRRYVTASNSFASLSALTSTRTSWQMCSHNNRLVVAGSEASGSVGTFTVAESIYIFMVGTDGTLTTLMSSTIDAVDHHQNHVTVHCSPWLTKVHYSFKQASDSTNQYVFKSVRYDSATVTDLTLSAESTFTSQITAGAELTKSDFALGEFYMAVRGSSIEQGFQFVGTSVIAFQTRTPSASESTLFQMVINQERENELVLLEAYLNNATVPVSYDVLEYTFGSVSTQYKVVPPAATDYFSFTKPTHTHNREKGGIFVWSYLN